MTFVQSEYHMSVGKQKNLPILNKRTFRICRALKGNTADVGVSDQSTWDLQAYPEAYRARKKSASKNKGLYTTQSTKMTFQKQIGGLCWRQVYQKGSSDCPTSAYQTFTTI